MEFVQSVLVGASACDTLCHVTVALLSLLFHSHMRSSANSSKSGASRSGVLSNVFGFFSREIESFVVNAAGGSVQASHAKRDHEQVQQILIHVSQQPPEPGPSGSSLKPKRVKKKPRRVNDTVYASPPDLKRGRGPKKDESGGRSTTSERSRRSDEPDAPRTRKPGESCSSFSPTMYSIHVLFWSSVSQTAFTSSP